MLQGGYLRLKIINSKENYIFKICIKKMKIFYKFQKNNKKYKNNQKIF